MATRVAKNLLLLNSRIVLVDQVIERGSLLVEAGRIVRIFPGEPSGGHAGAVEYDLAGMTLFPGFIDVHIHGAVGVDTMESSAEDLGRVSKFLSTQGVTAWLPTLVPAAPEQYERSISSIGSIINRQREQEEPFQWDRGRAGSPAGQPRWGAVPGRKEQPADSTSRDAALAATDEAGRVGRPRSQYEEAPVGARVLGVHYEGPFVNSQQCGALHREYFRTYSSSADLDALPTLNEAGAVHMMTLAPEIDGGIELVRELSRRGWIISIGHTRADAEVLDRACEAGARHLTHFMNAMAPLHQRAPGPIGWGLLRDDVTCDLIADGIHLDRMTLRLLQKLKTPARLSLISDAIAAAGLGDGAYQIWGETISVANRRTQNSSGSIAGSVITMLDAVRMMLSLGVDEVDLARMASTNPARLLRIERECGSIEEGKRADLVALNQNGDVRLTLVEGVVAYVHE
ncbi:MAG TPA: N-acetylglucosamine-6-phosphate deacetylase [Pyrinomonadaceae bacterium]|nr:N-acetylglucosamine-6-phosphate deacetylase [Pyrinomonadaceae bacterium]